MIRAMATGKIPEGFHSLTPYLTVKDAKNMIEVYKKGLGAEVVDCAEQDGKVMNAQLKVGDSIFMLNDEFPDYGALSPASTGHSSSNIHVYVNDVDALYQRMQDAG